MNSRSKDNPEESPRAEHSVGTQSRPSVFADLVSFPPTVRALTLTDLAGLVMGFAVAASIYRGTILAVFDAGAVGLTVVATIAFAWLGTVVAGPIVLCMRRLQLGRQAKLAAGESIWGILGLMWIMVGLARALRPIDPVTMSNVSSMAAAAAAGLAPLFFVLHWRLERARPRAGGPYSWCHHVGISCSAAWPAGWTLAAFLLGV